MKFSYASFTVLSFAALCACAPQSSPSMMNTSRVELVHETAIEQIPANKVDDVTLALLADDYRRYGNGPVELVMVYDPASKAYTAMKARNQLRGIEQNLQGRGVKNITTRTLAVEKGDPALMVSYESFQAKAPSDCHTLPGLDDYQTTRDIAEYRFGCSTESMIARQIAHPSDMLGRAGTTAPGDGRRATNVVEEQRNYGPRDANTELKSYGSDDIGG